MKKNLDNRELNIINRFLHGDHEAYSLLYKEHVQELFSYGKALTSNDERLKDAIQDVFYKILSNPSSLKNVQNLKYFLEALMPTCKECDIKMAIHMDDPPWDIFGLPRLLTCEENIDRFLKMVDSPYNCLTLCSGSLNADPRNNVADIVRKHCDRIAFAHIRNVKHFPNGDFSEASHRDCDGDTGILDILKAYHDCGFEGYIRPDHGRHLWGEKPGNVRPGYGLYDRALGIMYMLGVWDMLDKLDGNK